MANGTIRVLAGVLRPPVLETYEARIIEFRDRFGELMALFSRDPTGQGWWFVTKDDPEWFDELGRWMYVGETAEDGAPGRIRVLRSPTDVLADTHEATLIECRKNDGELQALFSRHFSDDMWIFVAEDDPDWDTELIRLGYRPSPVSLREILTDAKEDGRA